MRKKLLFVMAMALPLLAVSCNGEDDPRLTAGYTGENVSASGGTATFTIESNVDWTVANTDAWITLGTTTGNGDSSVTVTFAANTGTQERSSIFTVSSETLTVSVTITQAAAEAPEESLTVEYTPSETPAAGGTATFTVRSNTSWTVAAQDGATWLTANPASGNGDATVTVTVAANDGAARQGTLNVTAGSIVAPVVINQLEASAGGISTLFNFVINGGDFPTYEALNAFFSSNFTLIDKDGDGNNWRAVTWVDENENPTGEFGVISESFRNNVGPFTPENYLVLPAVTISAEGKFTAVLHANEAQYFHEKFKIVVSSEPITFDNCQNATALLTHTLAEGGGALYTAEIDVPAEYNGSPAYFAICHFDVTDEFILVLDSITITHNGPAPAPAAAPAWNPSLAGKYGPGAIYQSLKRVN